MKRVICVVMAVIGSGGYGAAEGASVQLDFDVPEIGTGLPYELASFSIVDYQSTGMGNSRTATVSDMVIIRQLDSATPKLLEAAVKGKVFKSVEIHGTATYGDAGEQVYLAIKLENVQITSYQVGVLDNQIPAETLTLGYVQMSVDSEPAPNPPQTPWGLLLPDGLPPGGMEPYQFDMVLDAPTVEVLFSRPPSPLGDGLPSTLLHVGVPEPATPTLVLVGLLLLGRWGGCSRIGGNEQEVAEATEWDR